MSTNDCASRAMPDEPTFTLLARDPQAPALVEAWAQGRLERVAVGAAPESDRARVYEALALASAMRAWRLANDGAWRHQNPELPGFEDATQRRAAIYNGEL
jgi:hypothetical protein